MEVVLEVGEVEIGGVAPELVGGHVVRHGGVLGGIERPQPHPRPVSRHPYLSHPLPPVPLPHPSEQLRRPPLPRRAELDHVARDRALQAPCNAGFMMSLFLQEKGGHVWQL